MSLMRYFLWFYDCLPRNFAPFMTVKEIEAVGDVVLAANFLKSDVFFGGSTCIESLYPPNEIVITQNALIEDVFLR